ncbi:MAG: hypothetical protein LC667_13965 [Thioalkalivibrio sp.]|nr:hypothetical protein [Thioalkalivibrio sp.]
MSLSVQRLLRACLLGAAAALLAPHAAAAQFCTEEPCEPWDVTPPAITISPGPGTYPAGSLGVTIAWSDGYALNHNSRVIMYGDSIVTSLFSYTWSNGGAAQSSGTVTVGTGSKTLTAYICDMASWPNCTSVGATYTGPAPAVRVTPDTAAAAVSGNSSQMSRFRVVNTGQAQTTYSLTASCTNTTACYTSGGMSSLTLQPSDSTYVDVAYQSPVSGTAQVRLTAYAGSASSTGTVNVTALAAPDPGYPGDAASLMRMERGHCLTVAMGPAVASECGSLRAVHALPSVRALNKQRTPVLIYNHDLARPNPIVAQHVTPPPGPTPDTIRAVLTVNGVQYPGKWVGWPSTQTRRIAVGFLASGVGGPGNKLLSYHWQVTAEWNGQGSTVLVSENRRMVVVDRSGSPFGAGWWLAGLEQIHHVPGDTLKLWVGGDGSARLYRRPGTTGPWVADGFDRPETIEQATNGGTTEYYRTLPGGARVYFSQEGEHVRTVNTLGHATTFAWSGTSTTTRRLEHVIFPATGANPAPLRYTFEYNNNATTAIPRLSRVVSPGPVDFRYTQVITDAYARVTSITDPGSEPVAFGYSGATALMSSRTDRRQSQQTFGYSAGRFHASYVRPHPDSVAIRRILYDVRGRGLAGTSIRTDSLWAIWDGERTEFCDCTFWRLDRWGAPVWMRDAYGQVTTFTRGDSRWPANVTQVVAPNGLLTTAGYDARGNLASTTTWNPYDDPRHATTTYAWDPRWDAPTRIVAPEGETTLVQYDALGRREWEQVGASTARRVTYRYYDNAHSTSPGLLRAIESPGALRDSVEYDSRGNLSKVIDPRNVATESLSDRLGRVIRSRVLIGGGQPGFQQDTTIYDLADRVHETIATGPAMNDVGQQWLHVRNEYDPEGNLKEVARWSVPDGAGVDTIRTRWEYDLMGRQIVEIAPDSTPSTWTDNPRDSTFYDRAGNPVRVRTRRFAESLAANTTDPGAAYIRMEYDALNRLTRRILPAVLYEPRHHAQAVSILSQRRVASAHSRGHGRVRVPSHHRGTEPRRQRERHRPAAGLPQWPAKVRFTLHGHGGGKELRYAQVRAGVPVRPERARDRTAASGAAAAAPGGGPRRAGQPLRIRRRDGRAAVDHGPHGQSVPLPLQHQG